MAQTYRQAFCDACIILAEQFGDALDRKSLWDRIASAVTAACSKVTDGDLDRFMSECLDHVKADPGKCSRSDLVTRFVTEYCARDLAFRQGFVRYVARRVPILIVHGRAAWQAHKGGE